MSAWTDFRDMVLGNSGPDVVASAAASTDVAVNPSIDVTAVNILDLEPLRDLFGDIRTSINDGVSELRNQKVDQAENSRLWMSAGLLAMAVLRKKS